MLTNYQNYYVFEDLVKTGKFYLRTSDINVNNWKDYYDGILNVMRDGIELDYVHKWFITVDMGDGDIVDLSVFDLYFNITMWYIVLNTGYPITGEALFFPDAITKDCIKDYFDHIIEKVRTKFPPKELNNRLDDCLHNFVDIDDFSFYIANTINLKDTIDLMNVDPEFDQTMHTSLMNIPIEDVKDKGMEIANKHIDIIINRSIQELGHDHCLRNSFMSGEGISPRQYKEFAVHIGSKPNGVGGVHPAIIDSSYLGGALNNTLYQYVDSSSSRVAQIQTKKNVGSSGNFARILGINNIDTILHPDPNYVCNTKHFMHITIKSKKVLSMLDGQWFRYNPEDIDRLITYKRTDLIGKTIYLRSPMTCASAAAGHGICYKCYGQLAYINNIIKPGKFAAEQLSSELTQRQLSAKHLLETIANKVNWNENFYKFCSMYLNGIYPNPNLIENVELIFDPSVVDSDSDDDVYDDEIGYNRSITLFNIFYNGEFYPVCSRENTDMYFTSTFDEFLMNKKNDAEEDDGMVHVNLKEFCDYAMEANKEPCMFFIHIENNELSKTLKELENLINRKSTTTQFDKDGLLQRAIDLVVEGKLSIQAIHLEVLLMNQIRSSKSILKNPDWTQDDVDYTILTLDQALKNNPSVVISLLYQDLGYTLSYPLTYKKTAPSIMDPFFMLKPQNYIAYDTQIMRNSDNDEQFIQPLVYFKDHAERR